MNIKKLVKPNVRALKAYQAEDIPCKIKLDANESPYGFRVLKTVNTQYYPDPEAKELRKLFAKSLRIKADNILHGNGSDELIMNLIATFGGTVLYPVPTFSMYGIISQALGETYREVPLDASFDLDMTEMKKTISGVKPKLLFLSSPNNPTGNSFSVKKIEALINMAKGIVVVDEAYQPFSGSKSFLLLMKKHKNLVVLRTLSKVGLAALRTGFMIAHEDIIHEVNKVRLPFNVNSLSQKVAIDALKKPGELRAAIRNIVSERKRLFSEMSKMNHVYPFPSDANFILFRVTDVDRIHRDLLHAGVLIRNMKGVGGGCLRVTVGTPSQNTIFLKKLKQLV